MCVRSSIGPFCGTGYLREGSAGVLVIMTVAAIILLLYILISHFILKRKLNIEEKRLGPFSKDRNKLFSMIEIISIIAFAVIGIVYINIADPGHFSRTFIPKLIAVLFFTLQVIRGLELWTFNREEKSYYHQSLGATVFLALFLVFYFSEGYLS